MSVLYFLIPISLLLFGVAIIFFFWGVKKDQYNDMESPAKHLLYQDKDIQKREANND